MNDFKSLGLSDQLLEVLASMGFEQPTPIQQEAIPQLLEEQATDFIGLAQTGTGKTAAFGLPLLERVDPKNSNIQALIMAPTRELGQQTAKQLQEFSKNQNRLTTLCVYGGANIMTQISALRKPTQILVATPGRLLDLMKRGAVSLDTVKYVVLDEADEMLQMGFKEDIDDILSHTPDERVTWLFSATMPADIRKIIKKYMTDPREVSVMTEDRTNKDITHQYVVTSGRDKISALRRFLELQPDMRGVMFCRTRRETQEIADNLGELGYGVEALHGELSQNQRDAVMKRFKGRAMQLLIATDVAARGIDVNDLTHVLHHRLPDQLESYTHRSGRTARAGKKGISLAFIGPRETHKIRQLEKQIQMPFEQVQVPSLDEVKDVRLQVWVKKLLTIQPHKDATAIYEQVEAQFEELEKGDIIKMLISRELAQLTEKSGGSGDLNQGAGQERRVAKNPNANRYFINVGAQDDVTERDLIHFLCDVSEVDGKSFSNISLQKNCAFFDLAKDADKDFAQAFQGLIVDGRKIRVNLDDEAARPPSRGRGFKPRGGKYSSGGDRRGSGGGSGHRKGGNGGGARNKYSGGGGSGGNKKRY